MRTKFNGILTLFLALIVQISFAQERTISGTVSDETGPLPGVTILKKGTTQGTETDFDGNYSIQAKTGDVLVFSFVGMQTIEKTVGNSNQINALLKGDNLLEEVVVLGYGSKSKSELTGSTVQINSDEISQVPVASVDQVLQGKVAGLAISGTSGTPGSTQDIRIRGISSITAGNQPLYVVDGVPLTNTDLAASTATSTFSTLSSINSNDIQSITVLKDASATAAYGARGANGVIVITTKKGKSGKTSFNFNTSVGFSNDAVEGPVMLTAAEREMLYYESLYNTYGADYGFSKDEAKDFYQSNPGAFGTEYTDWNNAGRQVYNWADVIKNKDAVTKEYNLSATGGDDVSRFYASLGLYQSEATVIGSDFERLSASFKYDRDLTSKLKLSTNNSFSNTIQDGLLEQSAYFSSPRTAKYFMSPLVNPYNADGSINTQDILSYTNVRNPLWIAENDINETKLARFISNNSLTWETPIENLSFTTRINVDYQVFDYKEYQNRVHGDGMDVNGSGTRTNRTITNTVYQNSLDYNFILGGSHKFDVKLLQEYQENKRNYLYAYAENFGADGLTNINSASSNKDADAQFTDWSVASYLAMLNYSYDNRYITNLTFRREGNSRFPRKGRWGNFWSAGVAWNIHNEAFAADSNVINNLKVRASYGVSGNANIGLNTFQSKLSFDGGYADQPAPYVSTLGNPDLSWETASTFDTGIDFGFFQNRLSGSVSYYKRNTEDLLLDVPLSITTGIVDANGDVVQTRNIGKMENSGLEFELNYEIIRSDNFNFSIGGNLATVDNEVLEMAVDGNGEEINIVTGTRRVQSGHTVYEWYMRKFAGVDPATGEDTFYVNGKDGATTMNISEAERAFQGTSALPTLTAGMNIHLDYKGFFLDANAYYAGGHQVFEDWTRYTNGNDRYGLDLFNAINTVLDRWQEPGDITRVSKVIYGTKSWPQQQHTKYLYDGDYIRLKNVTFGYDFAPQILDNVGFLDGARVFLRGTNLYTWVKDKNLKYDPEVQANGFTSLTTPPVKTISVGFNFKF
ncbi:SusC/RagA family TonB-linked outer membrane protein [Tenacibaculum ascidiaceicola]|uniref:SusC/RagA family TonB-linked outer membrane protein n=1 Tax=Tenacibaculum ascidiaceicola TaxID=1699411 RepID=UPI0038936BDE